MKRSVEQIWVPMEKAHYSTWYHCDTCTGIIDPIKCSNDCDICSVSLLNIPHPCPQCDGTAYYLQFSPEDHEKFLHAMHKDPSELSFLAELGMDKNDAKTLERGLNAVGPGSCYWKLAVALDRQLAVMRTMERSRRREAIQKMNAASSVQIITTQLSAIEHTKMELTRLMNQRTDLTKQIDALLLQMEQDTVKLRQAERAYAVTLVLAKE